MRYNAALAAFAACSRTLTEATMAGELPSAALVEAEKRAKVQLEDARARLHEAMMRTVAGDRREEPPA